MFNVATDDLAVKPYFYFNEFVANALRDNIGILNFDLWGMKAVRGQNTFWAHTMAL